MGLPLSGPSFLQGYTILYVHSARAGGNLPSFPLSPCTGKMEASRAPEEKYSNPDGTTEHDRIDKEAQPTASGSEQSACNPTALSNDSRLRWSVDKSVASSYATHSSHGSAHRSLSVGAPSDSDSRSTASAAIRHIKCEVLSNWLHAKCEEKMWTSGRPGEGVFVKKAKGEYAQCPPSRSTDSSNLHRAVVALNVRVC